MGHDLHVTRAESWSESAASPINESEWRRYVDADPELNFAGSVEAATSEGVLRYESRGLSLWRGHPAGEEIFFDLRDGEIVAKNPDAPTIQKLISIAKGLRARVQGDDGEIYDSSHPMGRSRGLSWRERLVSWTHNRFSIGKPELAEVAFRAGQRVTDVWGTQGVVLAIDLDANHRLGRIRVRFDDGRELDFAGVAHGLTPVDASSGKTADNSSTGSLEER